jgi:hypothetical protein
MENLMAADRGPGLGVCPGWRAGELGEDVVFSVMLFEGFCDGGGEPVV